MIYDPLTLSPPVIEVMLCCNGRTGEPLEQFSQINVELPFGLLEIDGPPLSFRWISLAERQATFDGTDAPRLLKVYGHSRYPVWDLKRHVGNIHWDAIALAVPDCVRLLNHLRLLAGWDLLAGPAFFFDLWSEASFDALRVEHLARKE